MTREEAIALLRGDAFKFCAVDLCEQSCEDCYEALYMAKEALEQAPKWIPCSERLPEKGEIVLTTHTLWNVRSISIDWRNDGQWVRNGQYVIAWQPLPEPYEGE